MVSRTPEGYIQVTGNGNSMKDIDIGYWWYYYNLKDHLGNTRNNLSSDYLSKKTHILNAGGPIDYYPFGLLITAFEGTTYANSTYLYNGKELDGMNGLNEYDYGARWQDPTIGRWPTVDPLAEKHPNESPYVYCSDNPISYVDPDGRDKFKIGLSFSMNSGFIGASLQVLGLGGSVVIAPWGGVKNEISVNLQFDTDAKTASIGGTYQNTDYQNSVEGNVGFINGSSSTEKSTTSDINTTDGYSTKSDQSSKEVESGGIVVKQVKGDGNDRFELNLDSASLSEAVTCAENQISL